MKKRNHIILGEYYWKGNLQEYTQRTTIKVIKPEVSLVESKTAKLVIESCLVHNNTKQERDHVSIRLQSIQEFKAFFTSLMLAAREFARYNPASPNYVFSECKKRIDEIRAGKLDALVRR